MTHYATICAIRLIIALTGEELTRRDGLGRLLQRFFEHCLRVSGAQFLARMGLELIIIQLFARWGSMAVLRYIQDAPLANQTGIASRAMQAVTLKDTKSWRAQVPTRTELANELQVSLWSHLPSATAQH